MCVDWKYGWISQLHHDVMRLRPPLKNLEKITSKVKLTGKIVGIFSLLSLLLYFVIDRLFALIYSARMQELFSGWFCWYGKREHFIIIDKSDYIETKVHVGGFIWLLWASLQAIKLNGVSILTYRKQSALKKVY